MTPSPNPSIPAWMHELNGAGDPSAIWIDHRDSGKRNPRGQRVDAGFKSGTWVMRLTLPSDLDEAAEDMHPLLVAMGLADGSTRLEAKLTEAVELCRTRGHSWEEIGRALGVSRQAAWRRFASVD